MADIITPNFKDKWILHRYNFLKLFKSVNNTVEY